MEFNIHLAHPHLAVFNGQKIGEGLSHPGIDTLSIVDTFTQKRVTLTCSQRCDFNAYTLKTVSQSESGFDTVAQQVSFLFSCAFRSKLQLKMILEVSDV